ncbi:hypothetical protein LCGC14_0376480 [marine sediment metagenome]|uniref:Uncharacterized protein n=1 Tax=marine sediment metagenome TaxID=412755 RepID=A0A0F9TLK9_9ZZZZ
MRLKYRFIYFTEKRHPLFPEVYAFECRSNRTKGLLGIIIVGDFGKWELQPEPMMGFTVQCLKDIVDFIGQL